MEEWKQIPGYEGLYDASSLGRIRSAPGKTTSNARYSARHWEERILKEKVPKSTKRHDKRVTLWKDGSSSDFLVARLVCLAWNGIPQRGMTVNHINGDYLDNRPENLEWISLADNIRHGFQTGLFSALQVPVSLISNDGDAISFPSMSEAGRYIGRDARYVSQRLRRGYTTVESAHGSVYEIVRHGGAA